jgi:GDP-L-fucose synthase
MKKKSKIFIAGHRGLVGSAIYRTLVKAGHTNFCLATSSELDLRDSNAVNNFFLEHEPEYVFVAAAKVGGILANKNYPVDFLHENLMIQNNIIEASFRFNVEKLLFLGSSCIYPKFAPQPIREESLLGGYLEPTNEAYAIAKIAGIKLCQAYNIQHGCRFISIMPTNLYGIGDNYHSENSHVLPALLRRFHEAKENNLEEVVIWGTGTPLREFMFADDLGAACVFLMEHYEEPGIINVGTGEEVTILELAKLIADVVKFQGNISFDPTKPDGTPRKLMDSSRLHRLGFHHQTSLKEGLQIAYEDFQKNISAYTVRNNEKTQRVIQPH